jgi:hypothetical protein
MEGEINVLDRVQNKAAKFTHQRKYLNWETLAQRRKIACMCALFKACTGEPAWKAISDRLQKSCYLSRVNHERKIRCRKQNSPGANYRQMLWGLYPVNQAILGKRLGK